MILSFRHKGLQIFFETGDSSGIQAKHATRLRMLLAALDTARTIGDMNLPGVALHPLKGTEKGRWSAKINANWRVTFAFRDQQVYLLDYEDYH